ncbi:hypothetical protein [Ferrovibrio sp.]|uniref:hypothetical protein n=1 Tax=Ferrovibrio sp. TaxID=1917215 RepID=UPI000CC2B0F3|nr:hypothetical protein [Ferrovibrio sp.]PJI41898.1 MAG: hypothetical protein CTR53_05430 [Ferrovibrio sp.]
MMKAMLKRRIAERLAQYNRIVIWGAGSAGLLALGLLPRDRIIYAVDSFSSARDLDGKPVERPERLREEHPDTLVMIASIADKEIGSWMDENGVVCVRMDFYGLLVEVVDPASMKDLLAADLLANWHGSLVETLIRRPQILVNLSYRVSHSLLRSRSLPGRIAATLSRLWHASNCAYFGIDIPAEVSAGPGLVFAHCGAIVVHRRVTLGSFCTLYQGTTLGANRRGAVPRLGGRVIVWAGAVVVGDCILGDRTEVGANSTVLGPFEVNHAIIAGTPARVLRQFSHPAAGEKAEDRNER